MPVLAGICGAGVCPHLQTCSVDADNRPVCTCQCAESQCLQVGPVCGTDGVTYTSDKDLFMSACQRGVDVHRNYRGECVGKDQELPLH